MRRGAWGTSSLMDGEYDIGENYYLLIWDDPSSIEVRDEHQLINALGQSIATNEWSWQLHTNEAMIEGHGHSRDIRVILEWLNGDSSIQNAGFRTPSNRYACDDCGYITIRRIISKNDE